MDSQAIVNTMEVLETRPITDLVSEAIIKVCYVSDAPNPNDTVITKAVGREIAATLPGAPVAGFFNKGTGDFEQHSRKVTFENGKFDIEDITKPYGFVSPVDKPWYQDFEEKGTIKTYLVCKAYFWTRQYEEASLAFGKGQSMELDEKAMSGYYQGDVFVFTSATLDKLCILGDSFAPCFAGAKIMSTYAKQYESLAEKLEKTIGRRYYVMADQLVVKPDTITLDYALELGWDLTDAVYSQLRERGMVGQKEIPDRYRIEGLYTEPSGIFAILQECATLELLRIDLVITDKDTIELTSDMVAVQQTWTPKAPPAPEVVEPLNGDSAVPEQDIQMNVSATYTTTEPEGTVPEVPEVPTEFSAEGDGALDAPATLEVPATDDSTTEPTTDFSAEVPEEVPMETPVEAPAVEEPVVDYIVQYSVLTAQIADFTAQIAAKDEIIAGLNAQIADYQKAETDVIAVQKEELISSYKTLLTEEEIVTISSKANEYSLDEVEAKLAVLYTRKQKASTAPKLQFDVNSVPAAAPELPDFFKQAQEYDKAQEFRINL